MISPARITALLSRQEAMSPEDKRQLEQVVVRFPFFVPAQLLLAAQRPHAAQSLQSLYLNPVLTASHLPAVKLRQPQPLPALEQQPIAEAETGINLMAGEPEPEVETETVLPPLPEPEAEEAAVAPSAETAEESIMPPADAEPEPIMEDEPSEAKADTPAEEEKENAVQEPEFSPVYTEDYFRYEGIEVTTDLPDEAELQPAEGRQAAALTGADHDKDKSLMVMMSFTDWLLHYRKKSQTAKDEEADQQRLKSAWQREKLAAALQEEDDEIPEQVFEMAVNSLNQEEGLVSESLAAILARQGKTEKALEMYQKLSLKYPQKSAYFASQIENLKREENQ